MNAVMSARDQPHTVPAPRRKGGMPWQQNLMGVLGAAILLVMVLASILAPVVSPHNPLVMSPDETFLAPSAAHPFGTDEFGRDLLSRVIYGTRTSIIIAAAVVAVASVVGAPLGLVAGYLGGLVDALIMRLMDVILAFPSMLLAMTLIAIMGQGATNGMVALTIVSIPAFARLARASTLQQKQLEYVEAARAIGATNAHIMLRSILPNCLAPILVQIGIRAGTAVLLESGLSFLGLGIIPPTPSLGQMLNTSRMYLYRAPWYGLFPGLVLTALVLSFNVLADSGQKILDRGRMG